MTVISAFNVGGVPVIVGDSLITTSEPGVVSKPVPTAEKLPPLKQAISGFCRKVHILDNKLVVAWAGSKFRAEQLLPDLKRFIRRKGGQKPEPD